MTVSQLITKLKKVKNKEAVVVICADNVSYLSVSNIIDETVSPAKEDGHIGNLLITSSELNEITSQ